MELTIKGMTVRGTRDDIGWFVNSYGLIQDCGRPASDKDGSTTSIGNPRFDIDSGTYYPGETRNPCTFAAESETEPTKKRDLCTFAVTPEPEVHKKPRKPTEDEFYAKA